MREVQSDGGRDRDIFRVPSSSDLFDHVYTNVVLVHVRLMFHVPF
jgi:hypothetical protein